MVAHIAEQAALQVERVDIIGACWLKYQAGIVVANKKLLARLPVGKRVGRYGKRVCLQFFLREALNHLFHILVGNLFGAFNSRETAAQKHQQHHKSERRMP